MFQIAANFEAIKFIFPQRKSTLQKYIDSSALQGAIL